MAQTFDEQQALAEVSIEPVIASDKREGLIAEAVEAMGGPDLDVRVGPLSTVVVGRFDDIVHGVQRAHRAAAASAERVITTMRIETKPGGADIGKREAQARQMQPES